MSTIGYSGGISTSVLVNHWSRCRDNRVLLAMREISRLFPSTDLLKFPAQKLKDICRGCGLSSMGTKQELQTRISDAVINRPQYIRQLVSIDIGLKNFATAALTARSETVLQLKSLEKISLGIENTSNPHEIAIKLKALCDGLCTRLSLDDVVLLERQTFRGGGKMMIPGIVQKLKLIEAQLYGFLLDQRIFGVDPRKVTSILGFPQTARKKKYAVTLVEKLFSDGQISAGDVVINVDIPIHLRNAFTGDEKKDDLADALLQAISYWIWNLNIQKLSSLSQES